MRFCDECKDADLFWWRTESEMNWRDDRWAQVPLPLGSSAHVVDWPGGSIPPFQDPETAHGSAHGRLPHVRGHRDGMGRERFCLRKMGNV